MRHVTDFSMMQNLAEGDKFYHVHNGECDSYYYNGVNCKTGTPIGISSATHLKAKVFGKHDIGTDHSTILIGNYDSKIVGEVIIKQLESNANVARKIYLKA